METITRIKRIYDNDEIIDMEYEFYYTSSIVKELELSRSYDHWNEAIERCNLTTVQIKIL
jgi:hypothetical protein